MRSRWSLQVHFIIMSQIGLQWSINRNVPSSNGIKNLRGCVFQTQGLDSVDDNERRDSIGFCKNACMHV